MRTGYFYALCACLCLLATGCGSSSSNNNDDNKIKTEDEATLQYCTDNPNSSQCNDINNEADDMGLNDYYGGGTSPYSDNAFANSGVGCGCQNGERTVMYRGVRRCEAIQTVSTVQTYRPVSQSNRVVVRYVRRPNGKKKAWVAFDSSTVGEASEFTTVDNGWGGAPNDGGWDDYNGACQEDFGVVCRDHNDCRGLTDPSGYPMNASCAPVQGAPYSYCQTY